MLWRLHLQDSNKTNVSTKRPGLWEKQSTLTSTEWLLSIWICLHLSHDVDSLRLPIQGKAQPKSSYSPTWGAGLQSSGSCSTLILKHSSGTSRLMRSLPTCMEHEGRRSLLAFWPGPMEPEGKYCYSHPGQEKQCSAKRLPDFPF